MLRMSVDSGELSRIILKNLAKKKNTVRETFYYDKAHEFAFLHWSINSIGRIPRPADWRCAARG